MLIMASNTCLPSSPSIPFKPLNETWMSPKFKNNWNEIEQSESQSRKFRNTIRSIGNSGFEFMQFGILPERAGSSSHIVPWVSLATQVICAVRSSFILLSISCNNSWVNQICQVIHIFITFCLNKVFYMETGCAGTRLLADARTIWCPVVKDLFQLHLLYRPQFKTLVLTWVPLGFPNSSADWCLH